MTGFSSNYYKNPSVHRLHKIGSLLIIVIDNEIADELCLGEDAYFYEILTANREILLRRTHDGKKENRH